jgi:hypothetical protein
MRLSFILSLIIMISCSTDRDKQQFVTFSYDLNKKADSLEFEKWTFENINSKKSLNYDCHDSLKINDWTWAHCLYQDDTYKVLGECRGEFGGSVIFIRKDNPDKANYMTCTCPSMVEKREDGFYVTETLAHMSGFGRIIKIKDPKELITVDTDSLSTPWKEKRFTGLDRFEVYQRLAKQGQTLCDTIDHVFSLFFQFKDKNYLIFSSFNATLLGEVKEGEIIVLDTLAKTFTWGYTGIPNEILDGIYHNRYEATYGTGELHKYSSGDIYVKQDTIVIGYSYKEWPRKEGDL